MEEASARNIPIFKNCPWLCARIEGMVEEIEIYITPGNDKVTGR
jgi:hypothetical protein